MECAQECDELVATGVVSGELHGRLYRLGARVSEIDAARHVAGRDASQPLSQLHHVLVIEIGARHVDEPCRLPLDGGGDFGVAVPGGGDGDAGVEIEKPVPVDILNDGALTSRRYQRIGTRVRGREHAGVTRYDVRGPRPG